MAKTTNAHKKQGNLALLAVYVKKYGTQKALAKEVQLPEWQLSNYLNGKQKLSDDHAQLLIKALKMPAVEMAKFRKAVGISIKKRANKKKKKVRRGRKPSLRASRHTLFELVMSGAVSQKGIESFRTNGKQFFPDGTTDTNVATTLVRLSKKS
jgi:plasmid maintenance system antidote protein VapI